MKGLRSVLGSIQVSGDVPTLSWVRFMVGLALKEVGVNTHHKCVVRFSAGFGELFEEFCCRMDELRSRVPATLLRNV